MLDNWTLKEVLGKKLLTPGFRRKAVDWAIKEKRHSQRRACELAGMEPKVYRYRSKRPVYAAIENGVALDGSLKTKIASLQQRRSQLIHLIALKQRKLDTPVTKISAAKAADFSKAICTRLGDRTKPAFARAYLHMVVSRVEVGKTKICITGRKETLAS